MGSKESASSAGIFFPFALIADLQREYFKQLWQFWNTTFLKSVVGGAASVALARAEV